MTTAELESGTTTEAAHEPIYRRNFYFFLSDAILFIVALNIISSTTVIPDFVRNLTDSEILIGFSGSMFDIGWTLPQLFVARYLVRSARKKWWFVGPNIPVRFVILIFAGLTFWLGKDRPTAILIAFFICYGIAALGDGLVGVPWADLSGTSMDKRWRARMLGLMSAAPGLIMLGITPLMARILGGLDFPNNYAVLFAISGALFVISIFPVLFVQELPGGKAVESVPSFREFLPDLGQVLRTDGPFRAMLIARLLTTLFTMAVPFYIGFATESLGMSNEVAVPTLLAMQTIGWVAGALAYMWIGSRSNLLYIRIALLGGALWPISALVAGVVGPLPLYFGYLMSGLALINLVLAFHNWVVTYADPDQRPVYIGLFNTMVALVALTAPFISGTLVQQFGYQPLFVVSLIMALTAFFVTMRFVRDADVSLKHLSGSPERNSA